MKKRILSVLLTLCMLAAMLPGMAWGAGETVVSHAVTGGNLYFDAGTGTIIDCDPAVTSANIPSALAGVAVTSIGEYAFSDCEALSSITIPDSVTSVGRFAFRGCTSLASLFIPDSVVYIGGSAFYYCPALTDIHMPAGLTSIESYTFLACSSLESIEIPDGVTSIGVWAFRDCDNLASVTIPASVTSIGSGAFGACDNLTDIHYAGNETQWNKISIGSGNDVIASTAIHYGGDSDEPSHSIESGTWGDNLTWTLKDGTLTISGTGDMDDYSNYPVYSEAPPWYEFLKDIKTVVIAEGVTSIGDRACFSCSNLENVTISNSVTRIGSYAFQNCGLSSISIPDSVTRIGSYAFAFCHNLRNVTLPDTVVSMDAYVFYQCDSLTSVTLPDRLESIGKKAFYGCSALTSVAVPASVTSIEEAAFYNCHSLRDVYYAGSQAQWERISIGANNDSLTSATIHFEGGSTEPSPGPSVESGVCGDDLVWSLENGTLTISGTGNMEDYVLESFSSSAPWMKYHREITKIVVEENVTSIGNYAFAYCDNLIHITIPNSVTRIGSDALNGCKSLPNITLPKGIDKIESGVFWGCEKLTGITIPDGVTMIGLGAFLACKSLTSITIPDGVTTIEPHLFNECDSLKSVTIPNSVTVIGKFAFYNCDSLTDIYFSGTKAQWDSIKVYPENDQLASVTIHYKDAGPDEGGGPEDTSWEYFGFANGKDDFFQTGEKQNYDAGAYFDNFLKVVVGLYPVTGNVWLLNLWAMEHLKWDGACYGISLVEGLVNEGYLELSQLDGDASSLSEVDAPKDNIHLRQMIHYYFLSQYLPALRETQYKTATPAGQEALRELVTGVLDGEEYLFSYSYYEKGKKFAHTFIIEGGAQQEDHSYILTGYDNRYHGYYRDATLTQLATAEVRISSDFSSCTVFCDKYYDPEVKATIHKIRNESVSTFEIQSDFSKFNRLNPKKEGRLATTSDQTFYTDSIDGFSIANSSGAVVLCGEADTGYVKEYWYTGIGTVLDENGNGISAPVGIMAEMQNLSVEDTYTIRTDDVGGPVSGVFSYVGKDGFVAVDMTAAASVEMNLESGVVKLENNQGVFSSTVESPGDGTVAAVTVSGDADGDVIVTPRDNGVTIAGPQGAYDVTFQTSGGQEERKTVTIGESGRGTVAYQKPSGSLPFTDIPVGQWYYDAVNYVYENDLMNGTGDTTFAPDMTTSRSMIATILYRMAGAPAISGGNRFIDVVDGTWYAKAVIWADANGIAIGYGNGRFGTEDPITREQFALMLHRYAGCPKATNRSLTFSDADKISDFALEAMYWAVEARIINGKGNGTLDPQGKASRAEAAQILKNYFENWE